MILRNWPFQSDYTDKMEKSDGVNGTFRLVTEKTSRMRGQNLSLFSVEREKAGITENKKNVALGRGIEQTIGYMLSTLWR